MYTRPYRPDGVTSTIRRSRGCAAISVMPGAVPGNGSGVATGAQTPAGALLVKNSAPSDVPAQPSTLPTSGLCGSAGPNASAHASPPGAIGRPINGFQAAPKLV